MVATVVGGFKKHGMWNDTLLLLHSDNGGELVFASACEKAASAAEDSSSPIRYVGDSDGKGGSRSGGGGSRSGGGGGGGGDASSSEGAAEGRSVGREVGAAFAGGCGSNFPLRGGKFTLWQGGVRTVAFLSGGALPSVRRGTSYHGVVHVVDLWASLSFLSYALGGLTHHRHISSSSSSSSDHDKSPSLPLSSSSSSSSSSSIVRFGGEDSVASLAPAALATDSPFLKFYAVASTGAAESESDPNLHPSEAAAVAVAAAVGGGAGGHSAAASDSIVGGSSSRRSSAGSSSPASSQGSRRLSGSSGMGEVGAEVGEELLQALGYSEVDWRFNGDTHLAAIMHAPTRRSEIILQPLNQHSTGLCHDQNPQHQHQHHNSSSSSSSSSSSRSRSSHTMISNPFRPSCASGIIRWPHKLLVGFPGDARHVAWPLLDFDVPASSDSSPDSSSPSSAAELPQRPPGFSSLPSSVRHGSGQITRDPQCSLFDPNIQLLSSSSSSLSSSSTSDHSSSVGRSSAPPASAAAFRWEQKLDSMGKKVSRIKASAHPMDFCTVQRPCLFNLENDPMELDNLLAPRRKRPPSPPLRRTTDGDDKSSSSSSSSSSSGVGTESGEGRKGGLLGEAAAAAEEEEEKEAEQEEAEKAEEVEKAEEAEAARHVARLLLWRLEEASRDAPPPVSSSGDTDGFPAGACAAVRETGSWLPWEWSEQRR